MSNKTVTKLIRGNKYVAEVEVTLIETDNEWSPYYSLGDVQKMEAVEKALEKGGLKAAAKFARIYTLTPVAAE
jgi:hypothetical protein